jgi:hypothetical protein
MNTSQLFAGADIGIWHSTDGGSSWSPYADGLPEAGVSHLKLHASRRLLRAATYGRGVYERAIDATSALGIELYARDTDLDVGRWPTVDWLNDPESGASPHALVMHWESPNIKVDPPASSGTYQATKQIDFFQFVDQIVDGSDGTATIDASLGTAINRVYVEVHNRGVTQADGVQVMLLLGNASAGLQAAPLPSGYASSVQSGVAISNANWQTVGFKTIDGLRVGVPQVAEFDLPSTILPPPTSLPAQSHYCLLALLHHPTDPFNDTETNADNLAIADRKVAQRNLQIVNFTGTLPPPDSPGTPLHESAMLVDLFAGGRAAGLVLDANQLRGHVTLLLPRSVSVSGLEKELIGGKLLAAGALDHLVKSRIELVEKLLRESRTPASAARATLHALHNLTGATPMRFAQPSKGRYIGLKSVVLAKPARALMVFEPGDQARLGDRWTVPVLMVHPGGRIAGGSTYRCQVVLAPDDERDVQLETRFSGTHLHVRMHSKGKAVTGNHGSRVEVFAASFTAFGMEQPIKKLEWSAAHKDFVLNIERDEDQPPVRRMTLIGRVEKLEGRKTIEVPQD